MFRDTTEQQRSWTIMAGAVTARLSAGLLVTHHLCTDLHKGKARQINPTGSRDAAGVPGTQSMHQGQGGCAV